MGLKKTIFYICLIVSFLIVTNSYSAWQGPTEVIVGVWGEGDRDFAIERGDTSDRLPWLTAILFDGKVVISDKVNEREIVYNSDSTLFKVVPWYVYQNGTKMVNPDYSLYKYWNIQGYTPEGNIWIKITKYCLKSPTGELLKTYAERPLELGTVKEQRIASGQYKVTVKYPDKEWIFTGKDVPLDYVRDMNGNLYANEGSTVIRYDAEGKEIARLILPGSKSEETPLGPGVEPIINWIEQYGEALVAPNGDVYTWKRTPDKYYIIKWIWQD